MKKPKFNITVSYVGDNHNLDSFYKVNNNILKRVCESELLNDKKEQ